MGVIDSSKAALETNLKGLIASKDFNDSDKADIKKQVGQVVDKFGDLPKRREHLADCIAEQAKLDSDIDKYNKEQYRLTVSATQVKKNFAGYAGKKNKNLDAILTILDMVGKLDDLKK